MRPSRWRPVYTLAAAVVALGAIAAPTLALSASVREFVGLSSPRPLLAQAQLQVSAPAPHGQVLRLYTAPSTGQGECWFVGTNPAGSAAKANESRGMGCTLSGGSLHSTKLPFQIGMAQVRRPNGPGISTWIPANVSGWISPTLHATRVELVWQHGHQRLAFANDYFSPRRRFSTARRFRTCPSTSSPTTPADTKSHAQVRQRDPLHRLEAHHVQAKLRAYWKAHGRP